MNKDFNISNTYGVNPYTNEFINPYKLINVIAIPLNIRLYIIL